MSQLPLWGLLRLSLVLAGRSPMLGGSGSGLEIDHLYPILDLNLLHDELRIFPRYRVQSVKIRLVCNFKFHCKLVHT